MRFQEINSGKIDTWDYSLMATAWRLGLTSLQINGNSIVNSGFGSLATHTKNLAPDWVPRNYSNSKRTSGVMPKLDLNADRWISTNVYNCNLAEVIKNEVKKVVRK
jgi:hypothetical protein